MRGQLAVQQSKASEGRREYSGGTPFSAKRQHQLEVLRHPTVHLSVMKHAFADFWKKHITSHLSFNRRTRKGSFQCPAERVFGSGKKGT